MIGEKWRTFPRVCAEFPRTVTPVSQRSVGTPRIRRARADYGVNSPFGVDDDIIRGLVQSTGKAQGYPHQRAAARRYARADAFECSRGRSVESGARYAGVESPYRHRSASREHHESRASIHTRPAISSDNASGMHEFVFVCDPPQGRRIAMRKRCSDASEARITTHCPHLRRQILASTQQFGAVFLATTTAARLNRNSTHAPGIYGTRTVRVTLTRGLQGNVWG